MRIACQAVTAKTRHDTSVLGLSFFEKGGKEGCDQAIVKEAKLKSEHLHTEATHV